MNFKRLLPEMIGLILASLLLVSCGTPRPTPTPTPVPPTPTPTPVPPTPTPAPEDYGPLEGVDCQIRAQEILWDADGFFESDNVELFCEGQQVDLVDGKVTEGWLATEEFGRIRLQTAGGFSMTILVTPEQNRNMIEAFK
jgi:hypothetical protein